MSKASSELAKGIEKSAKAVSQAGKPSQNKEELLARRAKCIGLITNKKRAYAQAVTDSRVAEEKSVEATARYNDWEDQVEARSRDVRLHVAHIGRLSSQVLEMKEEAQKFARTGETQYASSLIIGNFTLLRLERAAEQLPNMKAGVRAGNVKLAELHEQMEQAEDAAEKAEKHRSTSMQVIKGLALQAIQDDTSLSGLESVKENEVKEEEEEEAEGEGEEDEENEEHEVEVVEKGKDKERDAVAATFRVLTVTEVASARGTGEAPVWERAGVATGLAKGHAYHWRNVKKTW